MIRHRSKPLCIGQKQRWFLLQMQCDDGDVNLQATHKPEFDHWEWVDYWMPAKKVVLEFDHWEWVDYWMPAKKVVFFKRRVYRRALNELSPLLSQQVGGQSAVQNFNKEVIR